MINEHWDDLESAGFVKLDVLPDVLSCYEDLAGDCFNTKVNNDMDASVLESQEQAFKERIDRDGVWVIVGKYFDSEKWVSVDSCGGFVGDDWKNSGYDNDIMQNTIEALMKNKLCLSCGRPEQKMEGK